MTDDCTYTLGESARLFHADCRDALKALQDNCVDAVCTDPPYALVSVVKRFGGPNAAPAQYGKDGAFARQSAGFMGKTWVSCPPTESESRLHYSAKASKSDRAGSRHPTVKPLSLMSWLVKLITPPGGVVLDPFAGSGTTGQAALANGFKCLLVEREAEYVADICRRLLGSPPPWVGPPRFAPLPPPPWVGPVNAPA